MNWGNWQSFADMGGYGRYVWGSLLVVLGALGWEVAVLVGRRRAWLRAWRESQ